MQELEALAPNLRTIIHYVDLASMDDIEAIAKKVKSQHSQPIDILVANVGACKRICTVSDISLEDLEYTINVTINVNLRAPFLLVKAFVEGMIEQNWGRIIFVSSIAAYGAGLNGYRNWVQ